MPAIRLAFDEASWRKVGVVTLHAWSDTSETALSSEGWDVVREQEGELLAEAEHAQLVVTGSHGRGGFTGMLLGSTSAALLPLVECPMIVVRDGRP